MSPIEGDATRILQAENELPALKEELARHRVSDTFANRKKSGRNVGKFRGKRRSLPQDETRRLKLEI